MLPMCYPCLPRENVGGYDLPNCLPSFVNIKATKVEGALRVFFNEHPIIETKKSTSDKAISGW